MKRIIILFVFLFTVAGAYAQAQQTPVSTAPERAHAYAIRMQKQLALTAEQTSQIEALFLAKITAIEAVNADATKTQEQKDVEVAKIRADKEAEIQAVLTPEQLAKYNQMKEDNKKRREEATPAQE